MLVKFAVIFGQAIFGGVMCTGLLLNVTRFVGLFTRR